MAEVGSSKTMRPCQWRSPGIPTSWSRPTLIWAVEIGSRGGKPHEFQKLVGPEQVVPPALRSGQDGSARDRIADPLTRVPLLSNGPEDHLDLERQWPENWSRGSKVNVLALKNTVPRWDRDSRRMRADLVLPEPRSPTAATASPRRMV